jgi:hypothetical protein
MYSCPILPSREPYLALGIERGKKGGNSLANSTMAECRYEATTQGKVSDSHGTYSIRYIFHSLQDFKSAIVPDTLNRVFIQL